jgi:4-hydroxybenzoate polyprenyltransferase
MTLPGHQQTLAEAVSDKATLGGAATGVIGWLASINWIGLLGVAIALMGLIANVYFQHRRDKREQLETAARIEALRAGKGQLWNE